MADEDVVRRMSQLNLAPQGQQVVPQGRQVAPQGHQVTPQGQQVNVQPYQGLTFEQLAEKSQVDLQSGFEWTRIEMGRIIMGWKMIAPPHMAQQLADFDGMCATVCTFCVSSQHIVPIISCAVFIV